ncbi:uncharacterized protein LACBIDRAFT_314747 [Laccaria bicolor S238N-H82]|uniref:Predicted protein n=1 Tax=Laccaria bicolor (strain S238N-H82 / ATCC MYA-4686) TaxID=486041 RepID=B0DZ55_LACBS|nr:uncharacterized protein LACBIDRAFT_314747 [Laccaria bicolor S238N-H82]EDR00176.1 predicted protein [Laccaria bicolor S238N-H82]|eukprot:XP_001889233.1 predicted protein [Laccaria bicolor S238N-H82]
MCRFKTLCVADPIWGVCYFSYTLAFERILIFRFIDAYLLDPFELSYDDVATLPVSLSAAYAGLYGNKALGAAFDAPVSASAIGKYVDTLLVVLGGSSSVGRYVIQLAKYSGFHPMITTTSLKHADELKSLGATHVIDRKASVVAEVRKLTDKPISIVFDAVSSADTQQAGVDVLGMSRCKCNVCKSRKPSVQINEVITVYKLQLAQRRG